MTFVAFYCLLTAAWPECVKVVMDNIMAGKQENKEDVYIWLITHLFSFPFSLLSLLITHATLQQDYENFSGFLAASFFISSNWLMFLLSRTDYWCPWEDPSILCPSLLLLFLPCFFPWWLHPLSIIRSSSQAVFIEWLRMHRLLCWSLAHMSFCLGSLCSSFAFSLVSFHLRLLHHLLHSVQTAVCPPFSL